MSTNDRKNYLPRDVRASVVRETFETITAVGFMKWKAEELALGYEVTEEDRQLYFREFEKDFFADFQKMAAKATDDRLLDTMEFWIDKANTMGLKEWQQVLSKGEGAKPWYEELSREIAHDEALRRHIAEHGETPLADVERQSVLGYKLAEPSPAPAPQNENDRSRGR